MLRVNVRFRSSPFVLPVARGPAGIGCSIPMAPFGKVALPMVGMRGVMPDMGVRGASPAVGTVIGVNMVRFVPGIMDMLGAVTKPKTQTQILLQ